MLNTDLSDPAADSYLSEEEANQFFALGLAADAWAAVTNQEAALRSAASWLIRSLGLVSVAWPVDSWHGRAKTLNAIAALRPAR